MNLTLSHCFITVRDQEEALGFYRDSGPRGPKRRANKADAMAHRCAPVSAGWGRASLETPAGRPGNIDELAQVMAAGSLTAAIFACDERCALREGDRGWRRGGAGADGGAVRVRDCAVRDPSKNMVRFSQPLDAGGR